jgi:hypothetical protein
LSYIKTTLSGENFFSSRSPSAKRRQLEEEQKDEVQLNDLCTSTESMSQMTSNTNRIFRLEIPVNSHQTYDTPHETNMTKCSYMIIKNTAGTSNTEKGLVYRTPVAAQNYSF